jgi:hypothetical protein
MTIRKLTLSLGILVVVLIGLPEYLLACECNAKDVNADVSSAFQNAEIVMLATLKSVPDLEAGVEFDQQTASVFVEESYKGNLKAGSLFILGQGRSCDKYFTKAEIGKSFILFIGKPVKRPLSSSHTRGIKGEGELRYYVSKCGRSSLAEKAQHDIEFLDKISKNL